MTTFRRAAFELLVTDFETSIPLSFFALLETLLAGFPAPILGCSVVCEDRERC
jgi:hypothetical protein